MAFLLLAGCTLAQHPALNLLRGGATFVFAGTVAHGAGAGGVAAVRIDDIFVGQQTMGGAKDEMVRLTVRSDAGDGETQLWFCRVAAWSDLLELVEVGRQPITNHEMARRTVEAAAAQAADERLAAYLRTADVIVEGTVTAVGPPGPQAHRSEHDPLWREADIDVARVLRGTAGRRVKVLFPASRDIAWYRSPKLERDQTGTFVLRRTAPRPPNGAAGLLFLVAARDFYPPGRRAYIERLVRR